MRRALCMLLLAAMLSAIPAAGLAMSAEEALFGDEGAPETADTAPETADAAPETADAAPESVESPADDPASGDSGASTANSYPTLQLGDSDGEDSMAYIVFLQNRLIELGYLRDAADGIYGENTRVAVLNFQKNNNLPETGIADDATQQLVYSDLSKLVLASEDSSALDDEVTRVQNMLGLWGFYGGEVDGKLGGGTQKAVRNFNLYMKELDPEYGVEPTPEPTPTPNPDGRFADMPVVMDVPIAPEATEVPEEAITQKLLDYVDGKKEFQIYRQDIREGDSGKEALRVQTRLHQLKYVYATDGAFGAVSALGLKAFQRKNGLKESGVADEETQKVLFSARALATEEYVFPYKLIVDVSDQKVYVGKWTGSTYEGPIHTFPCATGKKDTPTPIGTYQAGGKTGSEWYYFKDFNCYAKWATHIVGGVLFHSNTVSKPRGTPSNGGLGHPASHGCVRLKVEDAKWIYDNCPSGTTVVVQQ